ncbi:MAG: pyrimidine 5'-nucleotidase [Chloroflexi bacterium]|nr:MAG: pyrimidine 5'-nucleotidase [Chloroflexota bacterium]
MFFKNGVPDVDLILFDVDNTLYPREAGLWRHIDERILAYTSRVLNLPPEQAREVQKYYWQTYGTTIAGLMAEHGVDPEPYLAYVHDIDVGRYLKPNPLLADILRALPHRKAAFTNATSEHAHNILSALGLRQYFEHLIGIAEVGYVSKPHPLAYERCLAILGVAPERCLFIEDSAKNLYPARELGIGTVLVGSADGEGFDLYIQRIEDLARIFRLPSVTAAPGDDGQAGSPRRAVSSRWAGP